MDGWMEDWMDGWMDGSINQSISRWMDEWIHGWVDRLDGRIGVIGEQTYIHTLLYPGQSIINY